MQKRTADPPPPPKPADSVTMVPGPEAHATEHDSLIKGARAVPQPAVSDARKGGILQAGGDVSDASIDGAVAEKDAEEGQNVVDLTTDVTTERTPPPTSEGIAVATDTLLPACVVGSTRKPLHPSGLSAEDMELIKATKQYLDFPLDASLAKIKSLVLKQRKDKDDLIAIKDAFEKIHQADSSDLRYDMFPGEGELESKLLRIPDIMQRFNNRLAAFEPLVAGLEQVQASNKRRSVALDPASQEKSQKRTPRPRTLADV